VTKAAFRSVDEYLSSQPEAVRRLLAQVRRAIRKAVPGAREMISYGIPTYKLDGRAVIYFAGWKGHYSIYPASARLVAAFREELAPYEVNDKGTIRFPLTGRVPVKLIAGIARFRAAEAAGQRTAKAAAAKKR